MLELGHESMRIDKLHSSEITIVPAFNLIILLGSLHQSTTATVNMVRGDYEESKFVKP